MHLERCPDCQRRVVVWQGTYVDHTRTGDTAAQIIGLCPGSGRVPQRTRERES